MMSPDMVGRCYVPRSTGTAESLSETRWGTKLLQRLTPQGNVSQRHTRTGLDNERAPLAWPFPRPGRHSALRDMWPSSFFSMPDM